MDPLSYLTALFPEYERGGKGRTTRGGFGLERQVAKRLREAGAIVVKSGGSLGPFDLVAIVPEQWVLAIQVKRGLEFSWECPIESFGCFHPILLQRIPNRWVVKIATPTTRS